MKLPNLTMRSPQVIEIEGLPEFVPDNLAARFRSRVDTAARSLLEDQGLANLEVTVRCGAVTTLTPRINAAKEPKHGASSSAEQPRYVCQEPLFKKDFLVLPAPVRDQIDAAMELLKLQPLLFEEWGLSEIEPRPKGALNFHGPPGTGKTLAAHVLASSSGKKILCASYADIESNTQLLAPSLVSTCTSWMDGQRPTGRGRTARQE